MSHLENGSKRRKADNASSASTTQPEVMINEEAVGPDIDLLRCPICRQFPRREVRFCNSGHSVCANCYYKLDKCPICQSVYPIIRNFFAEGILDSMRFFCSWKEFGCKVAPMERNMWTSHESQCEYNPNSIAFCSKLSNCKCNYKLCPVSIEDPVEMNVFLDHVRNMHDIRVVDVNLGKLYFKEWKTDRSYAFWTGEVSSKAPALLPPLYRLSLGKGRSQILVAIFVHFWKINNQPTVLFKSVRLTDGNPEKIFLSFSLSGPERDGPQVPEIKWTEEPEFVKEFSGKNDDLAAYYMIPLVAIKNYITDNILSIQCVWKRPAI